MLPSSTLGHLHSLLTSPRIVLYCVVLCCAVLFSWRNRFDLKVRYGTVLLYAFFVGTIFLRLGYNQAWAQERLSVIFVTVAYALYAASAYLPEIFMVRTIYFRETSARMYSPVAFFIARYAGDAPFLLVEMFVMSLMMSVKQRTPGPAPRLHWLPAICCSAHCCF